MSAGRGGHGHDDGVEHKVRIRTASAMTAPSRDDARTGPVRAPVPARSALEQELGLVLVDEEPELVGRGAGGRQVGSSSTRHGHAPGRRPTRSRSDRSLASLRSRPALLAGPEDGPLPPQLEVDVGQFEAVGAPLHGLEPGRRLGRVESESR